MNLFRIKLTGRLQIDLLLSRIESTFSEMHIPEPAFGAAVQAAFLALVREFVTLFLSIGENRRKDFGDVEYSSNLGTRSSTISGQ